MCRALVCSITVLLLIDKTLEVNVLTEETLNGKVKDKGLGDLTIRGSGNQEEPTQETRGISIRSRRRNEKSVNTRITTLRCWWSKY